MKNIFNKLIFVFLCTNLCELHTLFSMNTTAKTTAEKMLITLPSQGPFNNKILWWGLGGILASGIIYEMIYHNTDQSLSSCAKKMGLTKAHAHVINSARTIFNFIKQYPILLNPVLYTASLIAASTTSNTLLSSRAFTKIVGGKPTDEQIVRFGMPLTQSLTDKIFLSLCESVYGNSMQNLMKGPEDVPEISYEKDINNLATLEDFANNREAIPEEIWTAINSIKAAYSATKTAIKSEPTKTIFLMGDPGTGKTTTAEFIAREIGSEFFISLHGSDFLSSYVNGGALKLDTTLKREIERGKNKKGVIFFDECESLVQKHGDYNSVSSSERASLTQTLLKAVDKIAGDNNIKICVIFAANDTMVDSALQRRITTFIITSYPQPADRFKIIQKAFQKCTNPSLHPALPDNFIENLVPKTEGFTPADIKAFVKKVAQFHIHAKCTYIDPNNLISLSLIQNALLKQIDLAIQHHTQSVKDLQEEKNTLSTSKSDGLQHSEKAHQQMITTHSKSIAALEQAKMNIQQSQLPYEVIRIKKELCKLAQDSDLLKRAGRFDYARDQLNTLRQLLNTPEQNALAAILQQLHKKVPDKKNIVKNLNKLLEQNTLLDQQVTLARDLHKITNQLSNLNDQQIETDFAYKKLKDLIETVHELMPLLPEEERSLFQTINTIKTAKDFKNATDLIKRINTLAQEKDVAQKCWQQTIQDVQKELSAQTKKKDSLKKTTVEQPKNMPPTSSYLTIIKEKMIDAFFSYFVQPPQEQQLLEQPVNDEDDGILERALNDGLEDLSQQAPNNGINRYSIIAQKNSLEPVTPLEKLEKLQHKYAIPEQQKITEIYDQLELTENRSTISDQEVKTIFQKYKDAEIQVNASNLAQGNNSKLDDIITILENEETLQDIDDFTTEEALNQFTQAYENNFVPLEKTITQKFDYIPQWLWSFFSKPSSTLTAEQKEQLLQLSYYMKKKLASSSSSPLVQDLEDNEIIDLNHMIITTQDKQTQMQLWNRLLDTTKKPELFKIMKEHTPEHYIPELLKLPVQNIHQNSDAQKILARLKLFDVKATNK